MIRDPVWDRETAARAGRESTGHALPVDSRAYGAIATAVQLAPGEAESTDELAELVGDGIYVTRLHYLGVVNPREGVITGMTRDGTFRIRDGKVAEPLFNLRFTVAMPELLADVPGLTRDTPARQPERLLRRAVGVRLPCSGDGHRLLQRDRRRVRARALGLPCVALRLFSPCSPCLSPRARPAPAHLSG